MLSVVLHLNSLRVAVPAAVMMGIAPQYFTGIMAWRTVSLLFPRRWFHAIDDRIWESYQRLVEFFYETVAGNDLILYGDVEALSKKENVVYICNHQSTLDWVVVDMIAIRAGCLGRCRFILKDGLKYFPLFGFYFGLHGGIYVKRGRSFDGKNKEKLMKRLSQFKQSKIPVWMVVYPEGTRFKPDVPGLRIASQEFDEKQGLPILDNVLSPRYKATYLMLQGLKGHVDALYDATIAYSSTSFTMPQGVQFRTPAPSLTEFMSGKCPQIHVHLRRIPVSEIPEEEEKFALWLHQVFEEKDRLMSHFYSADESQRGRFPSEGKKSPLSLLSTVPAFVFACALIVPVMATPRGREFFWKTWVFGTIATALWMKIST